jgi:hypothetical protein
MLSSINSITDVEAFFNHLILEENLNFHPDEDFRNYIHLNTGLPSYTEEEAELRNHLLDQCFDVCERYPADIYQIGIEILFNQLTPKL